MANQLLRKFYHELLKKQKKDVRLVGNIGNPILSEKRHNKKNNFCN